MIKGRYVNLRPMEMDDIETFYTWITDQECLGDYSVAEMQYKDTCTEKMKKILSSDQNFFMIIENKEGTPIGTMNYYNSMASKVSIDFGVLVANVSNRGKGLGKEAVRLLINYLFNTKNIMRVQFITRSDNERMKATGQANGFKLDGILRNYTFEFGEYRDYCLYGITRDDWRERQN